ncbi:MAG: hypothetical protein Q8Q41_02035 [bacterium]|nr:hypothetical protein [bacterium]
MIAVLAFASIVALTTAAFAARRLLRLPICPICMGVAGTWIWLLLASWYGMDVDPMLPALLMGGSVVGIAYQLERRIRPGRSPLLMKAVLVPFGFLGAYAILNGSWPLGLAAALVTLAAGAVFLRSPFASSSPPAGLVTSPGKDGAKKYLEKELEQCC